MNADEFREMLISIGVYLINIKLITEYLKIEVYFIVVPHICQN